MNRLLLLCLLACPSVLQAQPGPGDVFREYTWSKPRAQSGGMLRVGGKLDYGGEPIPLPHQLDLQHAARAEVIIEKVLCHDGSRGLAIAFNDHDWIAVSESPGIPEPQWDYQHHTYPVVRVPLEQLRPDSSQFKLRVSPEHPWKWPQQLIYGVHLRVYYDAAKKFHPTGRIVAPKAGTACGRSVELEVEASSPNGPIRQVDFLGDHEDVNLEGDGLYAQWHYHYSCGELRGHLGSAIKSPWRSTWDTSWVPEQPKPFRIAARIRDSSGLITMTSAAGNLTLHRPGLSVELCKPQDVPTKWVTRRAELSERITVRGELSNASAAQMVWVSWSPGYMAGLRINGREVFDREGPRYAPFLHRVALKDLSVLKPGDNTITTGLTPKRDGQMVHGMEVNWPGIMLLVQYETKEVR